MITVKYCPYCGGEVEVIKNKIYCKKCKVVIYIQVELTSCDSPVIQREY